MAEQISTLTPFRVLDANGDPISGAKAYFYATGTTNLETVYTTSALSTAHPSPVLTNSEGFLANSGGDPVQIWHSGTPALKVVITDQNDVVLSTLDPAPMTSSATTAANISFTPTANNPASDVQTAIENASSTGREVETKGAAYTVLAADRNKLIRCTTDLVLTFSASSVLGNGWNTMVEATGGNVTITPDGSETTQIATIVDGESAFIFSDGSNLLGAKFTAQSSGFSPDSKWKNVTRAENTIYQNTTGYSIEVYIRGTAGAYRNVQVSTDNFVANTINVGGFRSGGDTVDVNFSVPNGHYYRLQGTLTALDIWAERRS